MLDAFTLKSRGLDMACLIDYKNEKIKGQKVLLYKHGFMGHKITPHRMIVNLTHRLVEQDYTVVRFDCVGAGDSEGDCHYTTIGGELEDTMVVIKYIKEHLKPKKFIILGYSMGGCVASLASMKALPDGLMLWSPVANPFYNFYHLLGAELFTQGLRGEDVDFGGDRVPKEFFVGLNDPKCNPLATVKNFPNPVRIVHGDGDNDIPYINTFAYAEAAPDVKYHIVPGATHTYDSVAHQEELFAKTLAYVEEMVR